MQVSELFITIRLRDWPFYAMIIDGRGMLKETDYVIRTGESKLNSHIFIMQYSHCLFLFFFSLCPPCSGVLCERCVVSGLCGLCPPQWPLPLLRPGWLTSDGSQHRHCRCHLQQGKSTSHYSSTGPDRVPRNYPICQTSEKPKSDAKSRSMIRFIPFVKQML